MLQRCSGEGYCIDQVNSYEWNTTYEEGGVKKRKVETESKRRQKRKGETAEEGETEEEGR
jgi:hypothetical protein